MSKILVLGEKCFDVFNFGTIRLSPEAPSLVIKPNRKVENLGMSANVAANLNSLNPEDIIETIHQDTDIIKTRYCCEVSGNILIRIDEQDTATRIKNLDKIDFNKYHAVVVSDYNKGFLLEDDLEYIAKKSNFSIIDTKKQISYWARLYSFIKINKKEYEYQRNKGFVEDLSLIVTLGKDGCMVYPDQLIFKYKEAEIKNQAGLGDTFLAGFVTEYLNSRDISKACNFANKASFVASTRLGVTTVTKNDINLLDKTQ